MNNNAEIIIENEEKDRNKILLFLYLVLKRIVDILVSFVLLVLLFPVFIIIAIAIKLESPGPVFFKHKRNGLNGKEFSLIKFRSMYNKEEVFNNTKRTKVGIFLRKYYLDEIPQLINVFKNDMSIVGPRPWAVECYEYFTDRQKLRFKVKPGMTGLAQIQGGKTVSLIDRIESDIEYVENISLLLDIKILFKTVGEIITHKEKSGKGLTLEEEIEELKNQHKN